MVCASSRTERIVIKQLMPGQDEIGQPVQTWAEFARCWADVRYLSGLEMIKADSQTSVVKASVRMLYLAGVTADMRIEHDGAELEIKAVMPNRRKGSMDLACEVING